MFINVTEWLFLFVSVYSYPLYVFNFQCVTGGEYKVQANFSPWHANPRLLRTPALNARVAEHCPN
jgi:hypothetical protein